MKKKITAFLLSVFLVFNIGFLDYQKAYAASPILNVVGSLNVEGLSGNDYIRKLAPVVGVALACIVGKCGLDVAITQESASQGMTKTQYLTNKFAEMATDANMTVLEAYQTVCSGLQYTKDGALIFSNKVKNLFGNFIDWAFNKNYVVERIESSYISGTLSPLYNISNVKINSSGDFSQQWSTNYVVEQNDVFLYLTAIAGADTQAIFHWISKNPFTLKAYRNNNGTLGNTYTAAYDKGFYTYSSQLSYKGLNSAYQIATGSLGNTIDSVGGTDIDILVGLPDAAQNPVIDDLQDLTDDEQIFIDAGFLEQLIQALGLTHSADIALADYISALANAIDGVATKDLVDTSGVPIGAGSTTIDLPITKNPSIDITKVPAQSIPDTGEATEGITKPEYETGVEDYTFDLTGIFPFCIPFDIYNFLAVLRSEPVAPNGDLRFYIPNVVDHNIHIDLSDFDPVARILRTGEIILFCIGLGFATKKIIKW